MEKTETRLSGQLIDIQYTRNEMDFHRGTFRVKGDVIPELGITQHIKVGQAGLLLS